MRRWSVRLSSPRRIPDSGGNGRCADVDSADMDADGPPLGADPGGASLASNRASQASSAAATRLSPALERAPSRPWPGARSRSPYGGPLRAGLRACRGARLPFPGETGGRPVSAWAIGGDEGAGAGTGCEAGTGSFGEASGAGGAARACGVAGA